MDTELKVYREIAGNLYSPFKSEDGISVEEIEQAEKIYGFRLPKALREFYLLTGNHEAINNSHNYLFSVDCLEIEDNKLLFYGENQGVCYWGIDLVDLAKDDPPVWIGQSVANQDNLEWYLESKKLTDFLIIMLCWQSVMGGLPFVGIKDSIENSICQKVQENFLPIKVDEEHSGLQAFLDQGKVICLAAGSDGTDITAGANSEDRFIEIEDLLQIEWDYSSLED